MKSIFFMIGIFISTLSKSFQVDYWFPNKQKDDVNFACWNRNLVTFISFFAVISFFFISYHIYDISIILILQVNNTWQNIDTTIASRTSLKLKYNTTCEKCTYIKYCYWWFSDFYNYLLIVTIWQFQWKLSFP